MASELRVRPYSPGDRGRLFELTRQVWARKRQLETHFDNRWWWQWSEPPLFVVEDAPQQTLVGMCACLPFTLRTGGRELSGAWLVDFYVLASCQGLGLGRRLTERVQEGFDVTASLSQTAMAYRVFQKMGWSDRTCVSIFTHPLPVRWLFPRPAGGLRVVTCALDSAAAPAEDLDALWIRCRDDHKLVAVRTGAQLLARYAGHRDRQYTLLCAYRGQECVGYMVARVVHAASGSARSSQGLIVDYFAHPDDTAALSALLSEAARLLIDRGVARIHCLSTSRPMQRVLGSRGFLSPSTPLVGRLMQGNNKWLTCVTNGDVPFIDPTRWFLTLGDCDIDYAWVQD